MILSHSRIQAKQRCDTLFDLHYNQGYRPASRPIELAFGDLFHVGLETWWKEIKAAQEAAQFDESIVLNSSVAEITLKADADGIDPVHTTKAIALITGYHHRWISDMAGFGDGEGYTVLGVEDGFKVSIGVLESGEEVILNGYIDAAVTTPDGRLLIVEHKTSAEDISPGSTYWRRIRINSQIGAYYLGGRQAYGRQVDGCLYDVIGKPKLDPYEATSIESRKYKCDGRCPRGKGLKCQGHTDGALYANQRAEDESMEDFDTRFRAHIGDNPMRIYQREIEVRLEREVRAYKEHVLSVARQIEFAADHECYPKSTGHCFQFNRECHFFGVCCGEQSLSDAHLFTRAWEGAST